jgi:hypothetical protein
VGGVWLYLYERSLLIAFGLLFVGSFIGHAISGAHEHTAEQDRRLTVDDDDVSRGERGKVDHRHGDSCVALWSVGPAAPGW